MYFYLIIFSFYVELDEGKPLFWMWYKIEVILPTTMWFV